MGKLRHGCDLLGELNALCAEKGLKLGRVEAIGAVRKACVSFYDQGTKSYRHQSFDAPMEILGLIGNISLKDGKPFVHAHVTLADESGRCIGGHLAPGTEVFACEFIIEAFEGPDFSRDRDDVTGLPLWRMRG